MTVRRPDDPISLLSNLLCDGEQRMAARAYGGRKSPAIAALVQAGMLVHDGVVDTTICDACGEHHLAEVESRGPNGGYGWHCPEAGFVAADPDAVAALSIVTNYVVTALGELFTAALGAGRWKPRQIDGTGDSWILGAWPIDGAWTTVVLVRRLDSLGAAGRTAEVLAALPQNDAGLVLTAVEDTGFEAPLGFAVVPLTASLMLDAIGRLSVDVATLARAIARHAARRLAHVGRPGVEGKVFAVLDVLEARGTSGEALNAGLVERAWPEFHFPEVAPSRATLRRHISRWRSSRQTQSDL